MSVPLQFRIPSKSIGEPTLALPRRRNSTDMQNSWLTPSLPPIPETTMRQADGNRPNHPPEEARNSPREQQDEQERILMQLEARLEERERMVSELEDRLRERERDIAETAALLQAREKVLDATRRSQVNRPVATFSPEEKSAMEALKLELDRHEASIREQKTALSEREKFLEENETRLFSKMQEHQEKELELEQKAEDLCARETRIRALENRVNTGSDTATKTRKWDEFRE